MIYKLPSSPTILTISINKLCNLNSIKDLNLEILKPEGRRCRPQSSPCPSWGSSGLEWLGYTHPWCPTSKPPNLGGPSSKPRYFVWSQRRSKTTRKGFQSWKIHGIHWKSLQNQIRLWNIGYKKESQRIQPVDLFVTPNTKYWGKSMATQKAWESRRLLGAFCKSLRSFKNRRFASPGKEFCNRGRGLSAAI